MRNITLLILGLFGASVLGTAVAFAGSSAREHDDDAAGLAQARTSMTQAVATAEQHVQGKAVRVELENEDGTPVYAVEVVKGAQVTDVKVNGDDGRVLSAQADQPDHEAEGHGSRERDDD